MTGYTNNSNLKSRFNKTKVKCYNFQNICHYARDYWNPTRKVKENINLVIEEKKKVTLLLVHDKQRQAKENTWYLDNGANNHMFGDRDKFMELDESIKGNVTFVDRSKVFIKEKGAIIIKLKNEIINLLVLSITSLLLKAIY